MKILFLSIIITLTLFSSHAAGIRRQHITGNYTDSLPGKIPEINIPDFADADVKQFYKSYAGYVIDCVTAIRSKEENKINAIFISGVQYDDKLPLMEKKATAVPAEQQKFRTMLLQLIPYQKEIVESVYYKNFLKSYSKGKQ